MSKKIYTYSIAILICVLVCIPLQVFGAQLSYTLVADSKVNQAAVIEVSVDPAGKLLNVVEGLLMLEGKGADTLTVDIETGNSALKIWPLAPKYNSTEKSIRFTGGVPMGFDKKAPLFKMRIYGPHAGDVKIKWINGTGYLNDGKGTKEPIFANTFTVNILSSQVSEVKKFADDVSAPTFEVAEIGHDQNGAYDGKYFISLNAQDDISGIEKYEVREGDDVTVVTDGVYVLKDQTRKTPLTITAYDKAGNHTELALKAEVDWMKYVTIILVIGMLLLILSHVYKRTKK